MSEVVWKNVVVPDAATSKGSLTDANYEYTIENTQRVPIANEEFFLPDPKALRAMTRASLLLTHVCGPAQAHMEEALQRSRYAIGVYCAVENGPIDGPTTKKMIDTPDEKFGEVYKKLRNPKMYLKQLPNLAPAQMQIFFDIRGPLNVYTHSTHAGIQALLQAEDDLRCDRVDLALVCSAHAFDDFLVVLRERRLRSSVIAEGAAAILLRKSANVTDWKSKVNPHGSREIYYGVSDQLIQIAKEINL
jgi:3-oxoacyl-(acyl-carrier-protein) synthase